MSKSMTVAQDAVYEFNRGFRDGAEDKPKSPPEDGFVAQEYLTGYNEGQAYRLQPSFRGEC